MDFWTSYGEAAKTAAGFFWKAGWAFVLGYFVSAVIQAFVPKGRLTRYLGGNDAKSMGLAAVALALVAVGLHCIYGQARLGGKGKRRNSTQWAAMTCMERA